MCGLAGFAGAGDLSDLNAMTAALRHRGPDDGATLVDEANRVYLGFRRLVVIDPEGGQQPMPNEDGSVHVVFNGEIYNHGELRKELERLGHRFRTGCSDTEVLVHGYEEWGDALPAKLNGMFAFAIWDAPRKQLFAARDRFGEKPLYYCHRPGFFAFASELSALIKHTAVRRDIDDRALQKYFAYGYVPAPLTLYRGVNKLGGGRWLRLDLESADLRERAYWQFDIQAEQHSPPERVPALADELRELVDRAVARRLVSDVPLGIFLSGGLDSSFILACAAKHRPAADLDSYTIGFEEPEFDESAFARIVSEAIGTRHHQRILSFAAVENLVAKVLAGLDEPTGDPSILPTYLLAAFARETVTVALTGDGADELFAGYDPFAALGPAQFYHRLVPRPVHLLLGRAVEHLPIGRGNMTLDYKLRRALPAMSHAPALWNPIWLAPVRPAAMPDLFEAPLPIEDLYSEAIGIWERSPSRNLVDKTIEFYTNLYLQGGILAKTDRASMMVSLESRAVYLDNDVVEFCRRLPHGYKMRNGRRKFLLKRAAQGLVPRQILRRRKKGFGIPLVPWLRGLPGGLPFRPISGLRHAWIEERWRAFLAGRCDERLMLWSWLSLQGVLRSSGAGN